MLKRADFRLYNCIKHFVKNLVESTTLCNHCHIYFLTQYFNLKFKSVYYLIKILIQIIICKIVHWQTIFLNKRLFFLHLLLFKFIFNFFFQIFNESRPGYLLLFFHCSSLNYLIKIIYLKNNYF